MNKLVVVTGAAGFLGSHIMRRHLREGDKVVGIDDYSSSDRFSAHCDEIRELCNHGNSGILVECDICDPDGLKDSLDRLLWMGGRARVIDLIYNFACPASPPVYQSMPIKTIKTCTTGVMNMLNIARCHDSVIVHASTSEVYGDPSVSPQPESYWGSVNPYGVRSCYDEGKRLAETLFFNYLHSLGVDARLMRIFNTYGPGMMMDDGRVVTNFVKQALMGEPMTVYGDGNQTRSFCYVDDLVDAALMLGALKENPKTPVNCGNPHEFTIKELAERVLKLVPESRSKIVVAPLPQDDPKQRRPDITLAKELLGWKPRVSLDEGLVNMVAYARKVLGHR